ncbi:MAG: DUF1573 domain-containing protein [Isosphaeraceae bacterium]|nr:DUF1573 domain-containing protein [Isosphaeraceae bacterium]
MLGVVLVSGPIRAASWGESLFAEQGHDFGAVPRGAIVRHHFVLTNRLNEPITILDVRASCGCTTGRALASTVPPGKTALIEALMDTRNFVGPKATTLTISLITASGRQDEVRLGVKSNILSDIVLNPGSIDFGVVSKGQTPTVTLTIDRLGAPAWRAERMVSTCRALEGSLVETTRTADTVGYRLTVSLKPDAPAGSIRDEIHILTNDPEAPSLPILVTAQVRGELTATPSVLALGHTASSGAATGRYLIRGATPFTITKIEGTGDGFQLIPDDANRKTLHVLTLSYRPEEATARGDLARTFRVHTDVPGEPTLELQATVHAAP